MLVATCPAEVQPAESGEPIRLSSNPVEQARQLAEIAAVADMRLSLALAHGTDPATLELYKGAFNLIAGNGLAIRRLAIAGLKSGEAISLEPSQRFQEFLERWNARGKPGSDDQRVDASTPAGSEDETA